ncbi:uncharacterized protein LOC135388775 [Ornithodoros turicata]|uniref:uncharacterized protein LOC135388775 n=1 Tax=Ornithodoros turicata TaxID=34597 RepID=UPI0031387DCB
MHNRAWMVLSCLAYAAGYQGSTETGPPRQAYLHLSGPIVDRLGTDVLEVLKEAFEMLHLETMIVAGRGHGLRLLLGQVVGFENTQTGHQVIDVFDDHMETTIRLMVPYLNYYTPATYVTEDKTYGVDVNVTASHISYLVRCKYNGTKMKVSSIGDGRFNDLQVSLDVRTTDADKVPYLEDMVYRFARKDLTRYARYHLRDLFERLDMHQLFENWIQELLDRLSYFHGYHKQQQ